MPRLVIMAHAPLACALKSVAAHMDAEGARRLQVVDVQAHMSADEVERLLLEALGEVHPSPALILCDVFGATPCNVALRFADGVNVGVVTGVNVAMLWRCMNYADKPLGELLEVARAGGVSGITIQPTC
jgi:mannose PTS system EIIA component